MATGSTISKKKKLGRPPWKPRDQVRRLKIMVRVNAEEMKLLRERAATHKIGVATYLRMAVLG